jgi:hypothetical protein
MRKYDLEITAHILILKIILLKAELEVIYSCAQAPFCEDVIVNTVLVT